MERFSHGAESARQRKGPKLMNRCKPEKTDTKEYGKMLRRILTFEEERVPAKNAEGWNIGGQNGRVTRKGCSRLQEVFEVGGVMAKKGQWNMAERNAGRQWSFAQGGRRPAQ